MIMCIYIYMEVSMVMGVPQIAGWLMMEHPSKMDDDWGYVPLGPTYILPYKEKKRLAIENGHLGS